MTADREAAIRKLDRSQMTRGDMSLAIDALLAELAAARAQIEWHKATKQALMDAHEAAVRREQTLREALEAGAADGETEALRAWCRLVLIEADVLTTTEEQT